MTDQISDERLAELIASYEAQSEAVGAEYNGHELEITNALTELAARRAQPSTVSLEPTVAEAMKMLADAIEREHRQRAIADQVFATMRVNIEKSEPSHEFAVALRGWWLEEKPKLIAAQEGK